MNPNMQCDSQLGTSAFSTWSTSWTSTMLVGKTSLSFSSNSTYCRWGLQGWIDISSLRGNQEVGDYWCFDLNRILLPIPAGYWILGAETGKEVLFGLRWIFGMNKVFYIIPISRSIGLHSQRSAWTKFDSYWNNCSWSTSWRIRNPFTYSWQRGKHWIGIFISIQLRHLDRRSLEAKRCHSQLNLYGLAVSLGADNGVGKIVALVRKTRDALRKSDEWSLRLKTQFSNIIPFGLIWPAQFAFAIQLSAWAFLFLRQTWLSRLLKFRTDCRLDLAWELGDIDGSFILGIPDDRPIVFARSHCVSKWPARWPELKSSGWLALRINNVRVLQA